MTELIHAVFEFLAAVCAVFSRMAVARACGTLLFESMQEAIDTESRS